MTKIEKLQATTMRKHGCSYNQIAKLLRLPKSTVASFCQAKQLVPEDDSKPSYLLCKECGELFIPKTRRAQEYCSNKCRTAAWRKRKATTVILYGSPEGLDFLAKESVNGARRNKP